MRLRRSWLALMPVSLAVFGLLAIHGRKAIAASPSYHLLKKVKLGGEGGWDYLSIDSAARRL